MSRSARLVTVQGPTGREWYALDRDLTRIGRRLDNDVAIPDPSVSRYHCVIRRKSGRFLLEDLHSANGISVNDETVNERPLEPGDEISVGLARFRFVIEDAPPTGEEPRSIGLRAMKTLLLDPAELPYPLRPTTDAVTQRAANDLRVLCQYCRNLEDNLSSAQIAEHLFGALHQSIPFDRALLALTDPETGRPLERWNWPPGRSSSFDGSADSGSARLFRRDSEKGLAAALQAPLIRQQKALGVLLLEADAPSFDEDHLGLAVAAASTTASAIDAAIRERRLATRVRLLEQERKSDYALLGESAAIAETRRQIQAAAQSAAPALIHGPRGSGKEVVAREIHARSAFSEGPFVFVSCLAYEQEELARLLFGRNETNRIRPGRLDEAAGGTLCLDRVDGLGHELQRKVWNMLYTGAFTRVGGGPPVNAQFRVLALARDEFRQTPEEEFDGSLLHRLSAHTVRMPGLAERAADIPVLAEHLVERFAARAGRRFSGFSPLALRALMNHTWPDNLPELESEMRFAESMRAEHEDSDGVIQLDDLSEPIREAADPESLEGYHQSVRQARRAIILDAMDRALGSHSEAADLLQINRTYLHRLIRNLGLKDEIRRRFPRGGRNDNDDE